jgi:hypothetical protein
MRRADTGEAYTDNYQVKIRQGFVAWMGSRKGVLANQVSHCSVHGVGQTEAARLFVVLLHHFV